VKVSKKIQKKLATAIEYLKSMGCKEVILFGSFVDGTFNEHSDIDLAVSGIPPRKYFKAVAVLPSIINHKIDLVALDYISNDFHEKIRKEGEIIFAE
jgi:predicted nucleotidyltransferase